MKKKSSNRKLQSIRIFTWIIIVLCTHNIYLNGLEGSGVIWTRADSALFGGYGWAITLVLEVVIVIMSLWDITHRSLEYNSDLFQERYKPPRNQAAREILCCISAAVLIALGLTALMEVGGLIAILRPRRYAAVRTVCLLGAGIVLNVTIFRQLQQKIRAEIQKQKQE